jgi:hypothetical protein
MWNPSPFLLAPASSSPSTKPTTPTKPPPPTTTTPTPPPRPPTPGCNISNKSTIGIPRNFQVGVDPLPPTRPVPPPPRLFSRDPFRFQTLVPGSGVRRSTTGEARSPLSFRTRVNIYDFYSRSTFNWHNFRLSRMLNFAFILFSGKKVFRSLVSFFFLTFLFRFLRSVWPTEKKNSRFPFRFFANETLKTFCKSFIFLKTIYLDKFCF